VLAMMTPNKANPRRMSIVSMRSLGRVGPITGDGSEIAVGMEGCFGMALPFTMLPYRTVQDFVMADRRADHGVPSSVLLLNVKPWRGLKAIGKSL